MVKMHKSPTRRRFPCAGDVPRFHHSRVRQRRVFRRTAGSTQSRAFCSFPRFRRWWRGHALCVTSLTRKERLKRNSMNSFSLCDGLRAYMYLASATLFTERKKERRSFPSTDANTFFALEREREREKACKILARKKWSKLNHSPKEKKLCARSSRDDAKRRKRRRDNESERDSNEQLSPRRFARARNLRLFNEKNNSRFKEAEECIINASRRKRGRRIGRRRRRLESDDRRGGERRRPKEREAKETNDTLRKKDVVVFVLNNVVGENVAGELRRERFLETFRREVLRVTPEPAIDHRERVQLRRNARREHARRSHGENHRSFQRDVGENTLRAQEDAVGRSVSSVESERVSERVVG